MHNNWFGLEYGYGDCSIFVWRVKHFKRNLDPCVLYGSEERIQSETFKMLKSFKSPRHIVNLGHGVYPDIHPENVKTFINTVKNYEI